MSVNVTHWRAAVEDFIIALPPESAVFCAQETRLSTQEAAAASRRMARNGWRSTLSGGPDCTPPSPGTCILWRQHLQVKPQVLVQELAGRAAAVRIHTKNSVLTLVTVYLRSGAEAQGNADLLQLVGDYVSSVGLFAVIGDWNCSASALTDLGWDRKVRGKVLPMPGVEWTCCPGAGQGRVLD